MRVDKWLWAARLVKTRALATEAIRGGRVHVNGVAVKPSRELKPGDQVEISLGQGIRKTVDVRALAERRGPAAEAARLYEETPESIARRESAAAERKAAGQSLPPNLGSKPSKRDRRAFDKARGGRRR
jgi:ribosome-associated heat shock protein Hsp15